MVDVNVNLAEVEDKLEIDVEEEEEAAVELLRMGVVVCKYEVVVIVEPDKVGDSCNDDEIYQVELLFAGANAVVVALALTTPGVCATDDFH